ncbi:MAG: helix-turn-helix transcriptional regulator [Proteobacteria bacterium]|nr:helix-turn-helix transcriptional regulator [Pseudomonadota bacterium]
MKDVFKALADESRRHLLDQLRQKDGQTLNEIREGLKMTRQAASKHLAILEQANLVICVPAGRSKLHYLNAVPLQEIVDRWVSEFSQIQTRTLMQFKDELENKK